MRVHRETLAPGDDYYRIQHNFGTSQAYLSLIFEDGTMAGPDWCIHQSHIHHIDIQFHEVLGKPLNVIVTADDAPTELTYRTSHGRELDMPKPVEPPAKKMMEHPAVREYVSDFQEALNLIQ